MDYRISGLDPAQFQHLFAADDAALRKAGVRRVVADAPHGYPCRVSLQDAAEGEVLLLLSYPHHEVDGPYRASGPIFVRKEARLAAHLRSIPPYLSLRLLSLRGYDSAGIMTQARVVEGTEAEAAIVDAFTDRGTRYLHLHNAQRGCYSCRVDRA